MDEERLRCFVVWTIADDYYKYQSSSGPTTQSLFATLDGGHLYKGSFSLIDRNTIKAHHQT